MSDDEVNVDGKTVAVRARVLEPDMSYTARTNGPDLWIMSVLANDESEDPAHAPKPVVCP